MSSEVTISDKPGQSIAVQNEVTTETEVPVSEVLNRFLEEQRNDYCAWQLILFFAEHPYIRFNRLAVIHALNHENGRRYVQKALDELIEQGIIKVTTEGNLPLYSLAEDVRRLVIKLTRPAEKE